MFIILVFFLQSGLFALYHLYIRKLEEKGVSAHGIAGLQRLSVFPSLVFLIATYKSQYATLLFSNPLALWWILGIAVFWGIGQYVGYIVLNSASSLSMVSTIGSLVELPVVVATAILINHDHPNPAVLAALILLVLAIFLRPKQDKDNKRKLLSYSVIITIALMFANQIGHAFDGAFYKNMLSVLRPETLFFGVAIYMFVTSLTLNIIYLFPAFKKPSVEEKSIITKHAWIAYAIPAIWFVASLPEGYSFAHMPLFTLSALGAFSFLIQLGSDIKNKRLVWNVRTALFALVVIASIICSALSLS